MREVLAHPRLLTPGRDLFRRHSYILVSLLARTYFQVPLAAPPRISRHYMEPNQHEDIVNLPESAKGKGVSTHLVIWPPLVPGALVAASEAASLLYKSLKYNSSLDIKLGSAADLQVRQGLYAEVTHLVDSLPAKLRTEKNFTPQTCFLR